MRWCRTQKLLTRMTCLGVRLDSKMSFKKHIIETGKKTDNLVNVINRLMPNTVSTGSIKKKIVSLSAIAKMCMGQRFGDRLWR